MASKLFNKLGVGKKHKSHIHKAVLTPTVDIIQQTSGGIVDLDDYSLPPDADDIDLYSEPADSLNPPNADFLNVSNQSFPQQRQPPPASSCINKPENNLETTKVPSVTAAKLKDQQRSLELTNHLQLPDLVTHCSDSLHSDTSYNPDLTDSHSSNSTSTTSTSSSARASNNHRSVRSAQALHTDNMDSSSATERPLSRHMNNTTDQLSSTDYYNQDSITRNRVNTSSVSSSVASNNNTSPVSVLDSSLNSSAGVYMNDSQLNNSTMSLSSANGRKMSTTSSITPEMDPRNQEYPPPGNEYESPWDLESEIIQVMKKVQSNPTSPLAQGSQAQLTQKSTVDVSAQNPKYPDHNRYHHSTSRESRKVERSETKVDYSKQSKLSPNGTQENMIPHKVRHPNVHRQSSTSSINAPSSSSVLVEGEWREAKTSAVAPGLLTPGSPELDSPAQIVSQKATVSNTSEQAGNSATNFIYDKSHGDSEIKVMLRYEEENKGNRGPCAQPRVSISTSPQASQSSDDQVYQNFKDAKKAATREQENDGVYDDPWNVDQVQQEILDQLELKTKRPGSIKGNRSKDSSRMQTRPSDLPSEMSAPNGGSMNRGDMSSTRRLLSSTSTADRMNKLSARAVTTQPSQPPLTTGPPVPKSGPGQVHSTKPVLVVHKTNGTFVNQTTKERPGSMSSRGGSMRKTPNTPLDIPECQHRVGLGVNKTLPLTQQPWYHGTIQRGYAEDMLRKSPDGSFLIRESVNSPRDKTLSLKNRSAFPDDCQRNASGFIHIKIVQQPDGTVILGQFSNPFRTIMDMVEYYSRHKVNIKGAEHTYLEIPVVRDR